MSSSVQSLQSQLKILEASATSPLALVPLARKLLELARKSAGLPLPELRPASCFWPATPCQNLTAQQELPRLPLSSNRLPHSNQKLIPSPRPLQPHRLLRQSLQLVHPSRPLRPPLPSFPLRSRERKRLRPKAAPLRRRRKSGRRSLRPRWQRPTLTPPRRKPNSSKPSITLSRLMIIPTTPPRNGLSTNPSLPRLPAVSGRP